MQEAGLPSNDEGRSGSGEEGFTVCKGSDLHVSRWHWLFAFNGCGGSAVWGLDRQDSRQVSRQFSR